ncbi:pantoate--beta-alanine ligase [Candidatus Viridilinea mediisalina]|uniref:Pantothenate synthetase n=1 Tax=Candidatus Viridilinea mediisalina TaxID=2024553 RepID=A0A2A6RG64_9CHLR|nr:pantoate--beta-alanine ligase [Candidatus Viridilinea mediisalina]PDW01865.1 pantoate--beta-alanine ligase [Candidatus Viridilinea mediisalina]
MQLITTIAAMRAARAEQTLLGLVPTMGYLHAGHLSLVRRAKAECGCVAVSIFVNPTQFRPNEDFSRYPRDLERDLALLAAEGVELVFAPSADEIYPADFGTYVILPAADEVLEGAARPNHFRGVATVVCKLFNIIQPTHAYFGQKDAQQTVVIRQMVRDLNLPVEITIAPTVREADGLALSSRNSYLSPSERAIAPQIYQALMAAQARYQAGERTAATLKHTVAALLQQEPAFHMEYISAADPLTLRELKLIGPQGALLSLAVRLGSVRLIDNLLLTEV